MHDCLKMYFEVCRHHEQLDCTFSLLNVYENYILCILFNFLALIYQPYIAGLGCDRAFCGAYWCSQGVNSSQHNPICDQETFKMVR